MGTCPGEGENVKSLIARLVSQVISVSVGPFIVKRSDNARSSWCFQMKTRLRGFALTPTHFVRLSSVRLSLALCGVSRGNSACFLALLQSYFENLSPITTALIFPIRRRALLQLDSAVTALKIKNCLQQSTYVLQLHKKQKVFVI